MNNETWLYLNKETDYVGFGYVREDGEVIGINFHIIDNPYFWGITVIGPDGSFVTKTVNYSKDVISIDYEYDGVNFIIDMYR